jgi:23S rRNA pseudouridine1911/1915/1917 synthase
MAYAGCPVAGDEVYGRKKEVWARFGIARQCLHAYSISFPHPRSGEVMHFTAPVWQDMETTLQMLRVEENNRLARRTG